MLRVKPGSFVAFAVAVLLLAAVAPAAAAPVISTLWDFRSTKKDGSRPQGAIVAVGTQYIYVAAPNGGANRIGGVFRMKPASPESLVVPWKEADVYDGTPPSGGNFPSDMSFIETSLSAKFWPILVVDNYGGTHNRGAIAELVPGQPGETQNITNFVRYSFGSSGLDGWYPFTPLVFGGSFLGGGNIVFLDYYGIALSSGNANGCGTVFVTESPSTGFYQTGGPWTEATVHAFAGGSDGCNPTGLVAQANDTLQSNALFGTASGGSSGNGIVYSLTRPDVNSPWVKTNLYTFAGSPDGASPSPGLLLAADGSLIGTTQNGGTGCGTVFRLTPPPLGQTQWTESILYTFSGTPDGCEPLNGVVQDSDGILYGVTFAGGNSANLLSNPEAGEGTVFSLRPASNGKKPWKETVLWRFSGTDGAYPGSPLVVFRSKSVESVIGTTNYGGKNLGGNAYWLKF